jgi:hypothetical protein
MRGQHAFEAVEHGQEKGSLVINEVRQSMPQERSETIEKELQQGFEMNAREGFGYILQTS